MKKRSSNLSQLNPFRNSLFEFPNLSVSHPIFPRFERSDNDEEEGLIDFPLLEREENEEEEDHDIILHDNIEEHHNLNNVQDFSFPDLISFELANSPPHSNLISESINRNNCSIQNKANQNYLKLNQDRTSKVERRIQRLKNVYEKYKLMRPPPNIQKNHEYSLKYIKNNEKFKGLSRKLKKCYKKYFTNNPDSSLEDFVKSLNLSKSYYMNSIDKETLTKSLDSLKISEDEKKLTFLFYGILNEADYKYILKKRKLGDFCNPFNSSNIQESISNKLDKATEKISEDLKSNNSSSDSSEQGDFLT